MNLTAPLGDSRLPEKLRIPAGLPLPPHASIEADQLRGNFKLKPVKKLPSEQIAMSPEQIERKKFIDALAQMATDIANRIFEAIAAEKEPKYLKQIQEDIFTLLKKIQNQSLSDSEQAQVLAELRSLQEFGTNQTAKDILAILDQEPEGGKTN